MEAELAWCLFTAIVAGVLIEVSARIAWGKDGDLSDKEVSNEEV